MKDDILENLRFNQKSHWLHMLLIFGHDVVVAAGSFIISLHLRLGEAVWGKAEFLLPSWLLFTGVCAGVFWFSGIPRGVWRYVSIKDMIVITRAVSLAILLFLLVGFLVTRLDEVPRSTMVINWLVLLVLISAPRIAVRMFNDGGLHRLLGNGHSTTRTPLLLVGTGDTAELFIREMARNHDAPYEVLGLINEEDGKIGRRIHGRPVVGHIDDLPNVLHQFAASGKKPHRLIVSDPLHWDKMQRVMAAAETAGITVARLPRITEFKSGDGDGFELQPVAIEDLLGRTQTKLDLGAMQRQIKGQRVLVTGAGGSIGSELARQVAAFSPSHLSLLDVAETLLYEIDLEISELHPDLPRSAILADVRNRHNLDRVMAEERPSLVFHAAALKHVPLVEANKIEGILTNAIGTRHVADACIRANVCAMVQISTDKAVNPTSIMGAAKRLAEAYCQALNSDAFGVGPDRGSRDTSRPRFITVRFGNVLGSSGSVVPLFKRQLAKGGPLTVTHPEMRRYFMTANEAVQLVLQALAIGLEGPRDDNGSIYVLNMGKQLKIMDLAIHMIRLAGLRPDEDVQIKIKGTRAGEKLQEELFHNSEPLKQTTHPGLYLAHPRHSDLETLCRQMDALAQACEQYQEAKVSEMLPEIVPEFRPKEAIRA